MKVDNNIIKTLTDMALRMRVTILKMSLSTGNDGAHIGPALSCVEILTALYGHVLRFDINNKSWIERDRFIPSKAHCVMAYYSALAEAGFLRSADLDRFAVNGSPFGEHPAMDLEKGIEYSGGSLGQALSFCVGMSIDAKYRDRSHRIFVLLGDGELDEGSNWEAFMSASHFKLNNLIAIIDKNKLQYDGTTEEVMALGDLGAKLRAFGWETNEVDGHDICSLVDALSYRPVDRPYAVIANTIKGKGISFMEGVREWHHSRITREQFDIAMEELRI